MIATSSDHFEQLTENARDILRFALESARPRVIRSFVDFAEAEVRIPEGKFQGHRFRTRRQPYSRLLLESYESRDFNRFASIGCVQSGKTLHTLVIPLAYHLFELGETCIVAAPIMDMCESKWLTEIRPVFEASPRLAALLPRNRMKGAKGFNEEIRLMNGATLKFMSAGGSDAQRSAFTSRVVFITEVDKMDEAGEASEETDPISQLESRTEHYGPDKRIYLECTLTDDEGRIWTEYKEGTQSNIKCRCPHCRDYVLPEREHLVGFEDAKDDFEAEESTSFCCPGCGHLLTNSERVEMVAGGVLLHRGQTINKRGKVKGPLPRTRTLGFRWNAFHNVLSWPTEHIALGEWKCHRAKVEDTIHLESREKKQCQFVWTVPYKEPELEDFKLDAKSVRRRIDDDLERGVIPKGVTHGAIGIDIGKSTCWWALLVANQENRRLYCPGYGAFTAATDLDDAKAIRLALLNSLRVFKEEVIDPGFMVSGSDERFHPSEVWIDAGYLPDVIEKFIRECGTLRRNRFKATRGRGQSSVDFKLKYHHPKKKTTAIREIGNNWYRQLNYEAKVQEIIFNADAWKLELQESLVVPMNEPGSLQLYRALTGDRFNEHARLSNHLTNERFRRKEKRGKGVVGEWQLKGQNHWLDAFTNARAALNRAGFRVVIETEDDDAKRKGPWFANAV